MQKIQLIILILFFSVAGKSQNPGKIESLDSFFAGLPLKENYDRWVKYIIEQPDLGIDSARPRGIYSSFKSQRADHFPFPDSVQVKLLLETGIYIDPEKKIPNDTTRAVMIEGIFENSKQGNKEATSYLKVLISMLKPYYKNQNETFDNRGGFANFREGKNPGFPDVILEFGYYEPGPYYYIVLRCEFSQVTKFRITIK